MVLNFLKDNFILLFLIIGSFILLAKNMGRNIYQVKLFRWILGIGFFLTIFSYLKELSISNMELENIRSICLIIDYSLKPVLILLFTLFISDNYNKKLLPLFIFAGINIIIYLINLGYPITFSFDKNYDIVKEVLYYSYLVTSFIYVFILLFFIYKKSVYSRINEISILVVSVLASIGSLLLEEFCGVNNLVNLTIIVSSVFYYFYLRSSIVERDLDTNLLNKMAFMDDGQKFDPCVKAVVSLGLNNLSEINKEKGFNAGNRALKTVAKHLSKYQTKDVIPYRISSSEFAVYFLDINEIDVKLFMKKIYKEILKCKYVISIECAYNKDSNNSKDLYEIAFNKMLEERNNYYELMNKEK